MKHKATNPSSLLSAVRAFSDLGGQRTHSHSVTAALVAAVAAAAGTCWVTAAGAVSSLAGARTWALCALTSCHRLLVTER